MNHPAERDEWFVYQIRVRGVLDAEWSDWFDEMIVFPQADGDTVLAGPVRDQCALHGILAKIRDLGLPLLSLKRTEGPTVEGTLCGRGRAVEWCS